MTAIERQMRPVHSDWYRPREELLEEGRSPVQQRESRTVVAEPHVGIYCCSSEACLEEHGYADHVGLPLHVTTPEQAQAHAPKCIICGAVMRVALIEDADGKILWDLL